MTSSGETLSELESLADSSSSPVPSHPYTSAPREHQQHELFTPAPAGGKTDVLSGDDLALGGVGCSSVSSLYAGIAATRRRRDVADEYADDDDDDDDDEKDDSGGGGGGDFGDNGLIYQRGTTVLLGTAGTETEEEEEEEQEEKIPMPGVHHHQHRHVIPPAADGYHHLLVSSGLPLV